MKFFYLILLGTITFLISSCADDTSDSPESVEGYYYGVECPRLELESFDDCLYEPEAPRAYGLDLNDKKSIAEFCQSSCNSIVGVSGNFDDNSAEDLSLLKGIEHVTLTISISHLNNLSSLHGLESLKDIEQDLKIMRNPKLKSVKALSSLNKVGRDITIQSNKQLKTLNGFDGLREAAAFTLFYNDELQDITALNQLEELNYFQVADSPKLPTCQAEYIR